MSESQQRGLRLLSLGVCRVFSFLAISGTLPALSDGGGIRGLSELLILQEIMQRIRYQRKLAQTPLPCDYFDLIGGTSTGGCAIT